MASSSSSFLVPCVDGGSRFRSRIHLCILLQISPPYNTCIAYAPHAKNAPHCSLRINPDNRATVPALLSALLQTRFPSARARRLLEELSTRVVCGITRRHQDKAPEVYHEWCNTLWGEYLLGNNLDPSLWEGEPRQLGSRTWEADLEVARSQQHYYSADEDDSSQDNKSDSGEIIGTPDTTTSDLGEENPIDQDLLSKSQSVQPSDRSSGRTESSVENRQSSRATFSVYRDPAPRDVAQTSNPAPVGTRLALRPLDQNIPVSHASDGTPPSWSHEVTDTTPSPKDVLRHIEARTADSSNTANQLRSETDHASIDNGSQATSNDEALSTPVEAKVGSEDEVGSEIGEVDSNDIEEQAQLGANSLHDRASPGHVEDADSESSQPNADEEPVAVETRDVDHNWGRQLGSTRSEANTAGDRDRDSSADGLLALPLGIFEDADADEVSSASTDIVAPRSGLRLYPQALGPLPQLKQVLQALTQAVSLKRRYSGFIYAFARPSLPGCLKIGYVQDVVRPRRPYPDPVDNRLAKWQADCGHPIAEVFRVSIACEAVERIERLVHATLREYRRVEDPPCRRCGRRNARRQRNGGGRGGGGKHNEWFEVEEQTARRVIDLWALFARQLPYDRFGRLVDFWAEKIDSERRRVGNGDTTTSWLETMPRLVEELTRREFASIVGPVSMMSLS